MNLVLVGENATYSPNLFPLLPGHTQQGSFPASAAVRSDGRAHKSLCQGPPPSLPPDGWNGDVLQKDLGRHVLRMAELKMQGGESQHPCSEESPTSRNTVCWTLWKWEIIFHFIWVISFLFFPLKPDILTLRSISGHYYVPFVCLLTC